MKNCAFVLSLAVVLGLSIGVQPAAAQLGGITGIAKKAQTAKKLSDARITDEEEQQIGQEVSDKVVESFGVYQDANVTKYVSLVGTVLAQASTRPGLPWQFVVLDTEGVNAFAAPGGYVHITKGLLGLMKNEAELAGVLVHEITHVTEKHTVNAIQQGNFVSAGTEAAGTGGGLARSVILQIADRA
jgi:predicted Zn-dependent protease